MSGPLELVQTRLAILDTSNAGHQPMNTRDGRYTIIMNGEIYNYRALRRELGASVAFRSHTDTEVVLESFAKWGPQCFSMLDGMFALAIWDAQLETLTLARDPLGIKPLYVTEGDSGVMFASELKALLRQNHVRREIRTESIAEYLTFLWIPEPHTMFRDITKLPAGHYVQYQARKRAARQRYFDLRDWYHDKLHLSDTEAIDLVQQRLRESVKSQMASDVPLGAFFSGGLDSTTIVLEMAKASPFSVRTQTVGFSPEDQKFDIAPSDLKFSRRALSELPSNVAYGESIVTEGTLDLIPQVVRSLDDPIGDPAAISMLLISAASRTQATVMLSGMGAEELWGGYARYWATLSAIEHWGRVPPFIKRVARSLISHLPSSKPGPLMGTMRQAKKFLRAPNSSLAETFITFESYIDRHELPNALTPAWSEADPWERHLQVFREASDFEPLDQLAYVDALTFLPSLNLAYTDRMSMAASLEVRVPFLSRDLVRLAAQLPEHLRLRGRTGKYVLKVAAESMGVPAEVVWRKKSGFSAPVRSWMSRQNHPMVEELLRPDTLRQRGILNPDYVSRLRALHQSGQEDFGLQLYSYLVLEQWFRTYVDGNPCPLNEELGKVMIHGN